MIDIRAFNLNIPDVDLDSSNVPVIKGAREVREPSERALTATLQSAEMTEFCRSRPRHASRCRLVQRTP